MIFYWLQILLQPGFRVFRNVVNRQRIEQGRIQLQYNIAAVLKIRIQVNSAYQCLYGVSQERVFLSSATFMFANAEPDVTSQFQSFRELRKGFFFDQGCPQPGEIAFSSLRKPYKQLLGDKHAKQRISQVFKPFIVTLAETPVS